MTPLPRGATDTHFHVFESPDRYPYASSARYPPLLAPLDEYLSLARQDGIERMVFVQPSGYGCDNRCLLDAMARAGTERSRGVVALDVRKTTHSELLRLNARGVRGARVNVSPYQTYDPKLGPRVAAEAIQTAELLRGLGWHLDLLAPGWLTRELLPALRELPVDCTVAHLGLFPAADGPDQPGFRELLDLARTGRAWIKLTGFYRISQRQNFEDVEPMVRAAIEAVPNRVIWGSDWPHISFPGRVTNARLLALLRAWAPDEAAYEKILVRNPARLYGFPP
jgi:2-pyrone-4,6-dicarboxylate lactonase